MGFSLAFGVLLTVSLVATTGSSVDAAKVLRIGTSGTLTENKAQQEESSLETLRGFIKEETGMDNEIFRQSGWRELVDKLAERELELGIFQGYEFAWARAKQPNLKPLALAINVYSYPVGYVVTNRNNSIGTLGDVQGHSIAVPTTGQRFLRLFVDHSTGKDWDMFFSKTTTPDNAEDALDAVVDGVTHLAVVDKAALEAYKRRKPGRFKNLKDIAVSRPFPPPIVAYYGKTLDERTLERLHAGLIGANRKEKGETLLTLFRLTGFITPPADFDSIVADTLKNYPAPNGMSK